jgi:plastocyanin
VRRHPLSATVARLGIVVGLAGILSGCQAMSATSSGPPGAVNVTVETAAGETLAFAPAEVLVGSVTPVTLTFRNGSTVAHNLTFTDGLTAATRTIVEPGAVEQLNILPSRPGTYPFVCTIHTGMTGHLVVAPPAG